jgi:hypothetical protein
LLIVGNKMNATCEFAGQLGSSPMAVSTSIGFVVDDNISVRQSLEFLIRNEGRQPEAFASAQVFLDRHESPLQAFSFLTFLF